MNLVKIPLLIVALIGISATIFSQQVITLQPEKNEHTEPLYLDLVRDLGARKGEKEINAGADFVNFTHYSKYAFLIEYEFVPVNRLGMEVEADFSFYNNITSTMEIPGNKLEAIRFSSQYSFLVSTKLKTSMAVGYTQIVELTDFRNYGKPNIANGTAYNPFFVVAKRWKNNFHTLLYTYPLIEHHFSPKKFTFGWHINTSFHYTIPHTKHFIGVEFNSKINHGKLEVTVRPQIKVKLSPNLALGIVAGFPVDNRDEHFSSFFRIIYEL